MVGALDTGGGRLPRGGGERRIQTVPMCRPDLADELRPPELARATVSRGNREAELRVMQNEQVMIESGEKTQANHIGSIDADISRGMLIGLDKLQIINHQQDVSTVSTINARNLFVRVLPT